MNILMLLGSRFPPDRRVEREVTALAEAGHLVTVLCRRYGTQPEEETYRGLARVVRVGSPFYPLYSAVSFGTNFIHRFWKRHLQRVALEEGAQAVHVHDLGHARTAILVAARLGIPSVVDLHENVPGQIAQNLWIKTAIKLNPLAYWIYSLRRWEKNQRCCLQHADRVITVSEELKDHFCASAGIDPSRIEVLHNVDSKSYVARLEVDTALLEKYAGNLVISYIGGLGAHRGMDLAVRALPRILESVPNVRMLIVGGADPAYEAFLRNLTRELGVAQAVEFVERVPFEKVPGYVKASSIGLVPQGKGGNTDFGVPNKLFLYWIFGVPVVVGPARSLVRLVDETGAGLSFESGDPASLAGAVIKLALSKELRDRMGQKGREAVERKYDWDIEKERLVALYQILSV